VIGEPDAGKPPVRFDEGVQETCDIAARLRPTLPAPPIQCAAVFSGDPMLRKASAGRSTDFWASA
jgi:hypothetical protein